MVRALRHRLRQSPPRRVAILGLTLAALLGGGALGASSRHSPEAERRLLETPAHAVAVSLRLAPPRGRARFVAEPFAHAAVAMEAALHDLPGVLARVEGAPPRPALLRAEPAPEVWRVDLDGIVDARLRLRAQLCPPAASGARCLELSADGAPGHPGRPAVELARAVARRIGVAEAALPPLPSAPPSDDPYAVLLLGRSAATALGLLPPPAVPGDEQDDPMARAVFVDPSMDLGWSLLARRASTPEARIAHLDRVSAPGPGDLADLAASWAEADEAERAWRAWARYRQARPEDDRFAAQAAIAAARGAPEAELPAALARLPAALAVDPSVSAQLEVALAERAGEVPDALLEAWQRAAPRDPRPVRRRLERLLAAERHAAALELAPALAARGQPEEAHRLTLALASNLGEPARAEQAAQALGRPELARRLRLEHRPEPGLLEAGTSPELRLRRAERFLDRMQPRRALEETRALLTVRRWWPEALDVERRAWLALGEREQAAAVEAKVRLVDPLFYEGRE